jgi:hypothetical protein
MSISNYAELQTAVTSYLHRSDLTAMIPEFITLAEAKINRALRLRAMENIATGAVAASVALPTGFVEMIGLSASVGSTTYALTYIPPSGINAANASARSYSIVGDSLYFVPSGSSQTYTLTYYKKFDALSTGINWLITNAPDVYMYATMLEAAPYIKDDSRIATWANMLTESIEGLKRADRRDRHGSDLVVTVS